MAGVYRCTGRCVLYTCAAVTCRDSWEWRYCAACTTDIICHSTAQSPGPPSSHHQHTTTQHYFIQINLITGISFIFHNLVLWPSLFAENLRVSVIVESILSNIYNL